MSLPRMTLEVWNAIRDLDPLRPGGPLEGCWRIGDATHVLYVNGADWTLVAHHDDPPPPPDLQGRMDLGDWQNVKGGTLDEELNLIRAPNESFWQIHHLEGEPGRAVPVRR